MIIRYISRLALLAGAMTLSASLWAAPVPCRDCSTGYQRGDVPSTAELESRRGPYSVRTIRVSRLVSGFGGGTIYYSTESGGGQGIIAVVPGYLSLETTIQWWGPRLASWGFTVITMDTNTIYDQPTSRASQLSAALNYVINKGNDSRSPLYGLVDPNRTGVIGWSMGGGGALELSTRRNIKATIAQAPWHVGAGTFARISTPTMILACQLDAVAPTAIHAEAFYNVIPRTTSKAYFEVRAGSHFCANTGYPNTDIIGRNGIAWMKRFIDNDTRYNQFLCGPNFESDFRISKYRDTCNY